MMIIYLYQKTNKITYWVIMILYEVVCFELKIDVDSCLVIS